MEARPPNPPDIPREPIPPELLAWARQTLDVEEFLAEARETVATGPSSCRNTARTREFLAEALETVATGGVPIEQILAEVEAIQKPEWFQR